ncbi:MAG: hypothetical protein A3D16_17215 [Rhodobacterales bacterium RIFCSPHIGHO2_02_FULL_62_130]|jgi:uncharacterized protein (UPF0303 family)|nr:MAG: hypothetical protein A3D16_17215 [Rhodobacterales bacterium RIFCSPHIGHO2_02_FULL_62_130]OHC60615.1 MAG: hypothetical protein A3E48_13845 [Rhodobacterales bacterium RIFCSPHIGHO2_12_FULL_62_75]
MDIETLELEAAELVFDRFDAVTAWHLGNVLFEAALAAAMPVVINIRTADRTLFHAALPGSAALNDLWARRKSNAALLFQAASLLIGSRNRDKGETLARHGLDTADYADAGGAVPIMVRGVGMVAVATVSGLPQVEDHKLVVRGIRAVLAAA